MKRTILSLAVCLTFGAFQAQTVVISDDFEGYQAGNYIAVQTDDWSTWSGDEGGADDTVVSTDFALSGTKSLKLEQTDLTNGGPSDIILPIGITSGLVEIEFNYYIPSGNGGYFNFQEAMQPAVGWSFELFFNPDGTVSVISDATDIGSGSFDHDTWVNIKVIVDIDAGTGDIMINDVNISQYMQDTMLGSINFFAWGGDGGVGLYYIDDVTIDFTGVSVEELAAIEFGLYPNPAADAVSIDLGNLNDASVRIFDLSGKIVSQTLISGSGIQTMDISELNQGIYIVEVAANNSTSMKRLTVQK